MESFVLNIKATSEDGVEIKQSIDAKVNCSRDMAVSVILHALKANDDLRHLVMTAVLTFIEEERIDQHKNNQNDEA